MKKLNIFFLLCLTMAMALVSCSDDVPDPIDPVRTYTNTVFVYMPWTGSETSASGSLTNDFRKNLRDIESTIKQGNGNTETRTIVLFADSSARSRLFEVRDDSTEYTISNLSDGAMTTEVELRNLLNSVADYSHTDTYSIIVGSHGSGWLPAGSRPFETRSFGGTTAGMQTEIKTLANAITSSNIGKMQYICFDDCYMANIETAYALRNATNWLLASTSEVMAEGLPYSTIWKYLSEPNADYSGIIDGFGNYYSNSYGAFSAIDCSKAEEMATLMKQLNEKYAGWDYDLSTIQALDGYRSHVYYDMGDYINKVCGNDTVDNKAIYNELKEIVPYKFTTPRIYTVYQGSYTFPVRTFSGIAISDPSINPTALQYKESTDWWVATH